MLLAAVSCSEQPSGGIADARGLERLSDWGAVPVLPSEPASYVQLTSRDRGTSDASFPLSDHGNRDFNNFVCSSGDAQLGAAQLVPMRVDLPRCPEPYVRGVVLARFEGEGRLLRVWLTTLLLATGSDAARATRLRIYADDQPQAVLDLPLTAAALPGPGEPSIFAPAFGAGSPGRVAWYYPIAFQSKLIVALDSIADHEAVYYHCDVKHEAVEPLPLDSDAERSLRAAASQQLTAAEPVGSLLDLTPRRELQLAAREAIALPLNGPATIHSFELRVAVAELARLRELRLRVFWDDASEPAIDLPISELFGGGLEPPHVSSLALASERQGDDQLLALRLPMPFALRARITLENSSAAPLALQLALRGEPGVREAAGRLHAALRETRGPSDVPEHEVLNETGRGRLVGVCTYVEGHADPGLGIQGDPLNVLEGDVLASIDGRPALNGTGSEEYADDMFYFHDAPHGNAFAQVWGVHDGKASFCRWHVLGGELDFAQALRLTFERGGVGNPTVADLHRTVAYYYLPL
ncbi:MAG TPA: DUF2961 domain-containing protein [Polyangiales bacterium]|nr:DUF2961 domain-containing protein [Polyangiales bacterium]